MVAIKVQGITKRFRSGSGAEVTAVDNLSFEVGSGELFTLLGPSGCGKTTTLRCLAGFEVPELGRIEINDEPVYDERTGKFVPPERRDIGFVFQSYALWPHMTARENILYALKNRGYPKADRENRIDEMLELVNLPDVKERYPSELSGGQQQRIAAARALSYEPAILLMDEPLSNLDFQQRKRMRKDFLDILEEVETSVVYVTHDQEEAFEISNQVAIIQSGRKVQEGRPSDIYSNPRSPFVARFIGDANVLEVELTRELDDDLIVCTPIGSNDEFSIRCLRDTQIEYQEPELVIQPENIKVARSTDVQDSEGKNGPEENTFRGSVTQHFYRGGSSLTEIRIGETHLMAKTLNERFVEGEEVIITIPPELVRLVGTPK